MKRHPAVTSPARARLNRRAFIAGAGAFLGSRMARADDAPVDLLSRIAKAREPVRTIQGPFTQTRTIGLLATDVHSHGRMALMRPDRLRWELEPPDDITFWIGPEGLAYRSAHGQGKMSEGGLRVSAALDDMRTLLGGDLRRLAERWSLRVVRDDDAGAELEATARAATAAAIRSMRFALGADLIRPTRAILVEGPRDHTTIEFGPLAVNEPLAKSFMSPG